MTRRSGRHKLRRLFGVSPADRVWRGAAVVWQLGIATAGPPGGVCDRVPAWWRGPAVFEETGVSVRAVFLFADQFDARPSL